MSNIMSILTKYQFLKIKMNIVNFDFSQIKQSLSFQINGLNCTIILVDKTMVL